MENTVKELKKRIYSFGAAYKPSDVFRDFVELAALAIFNSYMRDDDWEIREERYHTIRREYKEEAFDPTKPIRLNKFLSCWAFWLRAALER